MGVMRNEVRSGSWVWLAIMTTTGAGCTFMGAFLPSVSLAWHLADWQAGLLLSCLFLGSFSGTLLLADDLARTLSLGAVAATVGLLAFAAILHQATGFWEATLSLTLMGFGLGQLMSSINLLVGAAPIAQRSRYIARIGVAWCLGAVLSPLLTTVLFTGLAAPTRLGLFATLYLIPLFIAIRGTLPIRQTSTTSSHAIPTERGSRKLALIGVLVFLIYGGTEASIGGWMSMFALRYRGGPMGYAQWIMSVFWGGLILGRLVIALLATPATDAMIVRLSLIGSLGTLTWLVLNPSPLSLLAGCAIAGVCMAPLFPMFLSATIECRLSARVMGAILAACGLGAAVFPSLLGVLSNARSLQTAMLVPITGLLLLVLLRWRPPNRNPDLQLL